MENRTLKDWKLYRQFRKTLDTICSDHSDEQTWLFNSNSPQSPTKSFDDILEITSIEDEGEFLDGTGEDHLLLQKFNEKLVSCIRVLSARGRL